MINYNQYKDFALYSGIVSSAFLTYNLLRINRRKNKKIEIDKDITKEEVLLKWKIFFSKAKRDPVRDFFNRNLYYLILIENKLNHQCISYTLEDLKYQKLNNFIKDLKGKKKQLQKEERIFFNFVSDYSKSMQSCSSNVRTNALLS